MYGWHYNQNAAKSNVSCAANTVGVKIEYNNTQGLKLDLGGESSIYKWDVAFFDFTMTAKTSRARGSWR